MLFRQLEYLVALSRERHFTRAAEACHVSQPALSEAIRKLEIELDLPLIVRGRKFEGLTPEGEQIVRWARRIVADQQALKHEAAALRSGVAGTVRLGAVPTASATVADLTGPLCQKHPLVTVNLAEDLPSGEITSRIDRFELDGGITYLDDDIESRFRTFPLYREYYDLLVSVDSSAMDAKDTPGDSITWREASSLPLCALPSMMRGRRILDEFFAYDGATHTPRVETDSIASLYAHVKTGHWAAVVPRVWRHVFGEPPGLRCLPLASELEAPVIGLITARSSQGSALIRALEETAIGLEQQSSASPIER
ncbi:LysR family transcriptional regulator [Rhodococcoides kyotonense]|uniref:DNA-binding transcriptional regulator, LysR family n=1 Tax=Rhodococcoides kyotonense TaxID=398843 RepID=A0A239MIZ3_9NOCA|nr:LysR family transcriptional regulator [Rhodococcus kyotonensis]SNT42042.1 DNA-binding transcriptional regulator, LysR family [Rhodococcus kyotonensis]